ncbi:Helix-turn-helix domain protein [Bacteroidales bacterium Barb6]|nr:Helix-turn-helix domain protein [Bacteroidales bacterium Barb6]
MEISKLLALAKECPNVIISIAVGDLIEANEALIRKTKAELEQLITDANTETYPSPDQVAKILGVDKSTLWRWTKSKYLIPIEIGGKRRYRMSDINRILEGGDKK